MEKSLKKNQKNSENTRLIYSIKVLERTSHRMKFTIFTPSYNRAHTLPRLFDSLKKQTFQDFEWLIVDDGSTDETQKIIEEIQRSEKTFPITYLKTENGGKHRAINLGLKHARGELFFIVDSDDYLPEKSLEIFDQVEKTIPAEQKQNFAGICGQRYYIKEDKAIGTTFHDNEFLDITTNERAKYKIFGDKSEVVYTDIFRKYPFPEIPGETFCTENIVWDRIAHDGFLFRFFNGDVYRCDYLNDGLTNKGLKLYAANPVQWGIDIYQAREFKKINFYEDTVLCFTYYIWLKNKLPIQEIAKNLHLSIFRLRFIILIQRTANLARYILGKKVLSTN